MKISEALKLSGLTEIPLAFHDVDLSSFQGDVSNYTSEAFKNEIKAIQQINDQNVIDFIALTSLHIKGSALDLNQIQVFPIPELIKLSSLYANLAVAKIENFYLFPERVEVSFVQNHEHIALKYFKKCSHSARLVALNKWQIVSKEFLSLCQEKLDTRNGHKITEREVVETLEHYDLVENVLAKYFEYNKFSKNLEHWSSVAIALIGKKAELALDPRFYTHKNCNILVACAKASEDALKLILNNREISDWNKDHCIEARPEYILEYLKNDHEYSPSVSTTLKFGSVDAIKFLLSSRKDLKIFNNYQAILAKPELYEAAFLRDDVFDVDCLLQMATDIGPDTNHPIAPYLLKTQNINLCLFLIKLSAQWAVYLVNHPSAHVQLACVNRSKKAKALVSA